MVPYDWRHYVKLLFRCYSRTIPPFPSPLLAPPAHALCTALSAQLQATLTHPQPLKPRTPGPPTRLNYTLHCSRHPPPNGLLSGARYAVRTAAPHAKQAILLGSSINAHLPIKAHMLLNGAVATQRGAVLVVSGDRPRKPNHPCRHPRSRSLSPSGNEWRPEP